MCRSVLAPSWLSSNRAWKIAPGGGDGVYSPLGELLKNCQAVVTSVGHKCLSYRTVSPPPAVHVMCVLCDVLSITFLFTRRHGQHTQCPSC